MQNLNDRVEGIFRGVVLIALSFVASIALLMFRPIDGYVQLATRIRQKSAKENQVRPYAFVFFAIVLVFFVPSLMDSLAPHVAGPFEYQVHDSAVPDSGALGRAYQQTTQKIESKAATAIFVAAIVGVAAFHLCATGSGLALLRLRARRETWRDALFFVGGLQVVVFAVVTLVDRLGWASTTETGLLRDFLLSPRTLALGYGDARPYPVYLDIIDVALLVVALLIPFGLARRYASRLSVGSGAVGGHWRNWIRTIGLILLIDGAAIGSFSVAAYVVDQIQPRDKPIYPFSIQNVGCRFEPNPSKPVITGTAVLKVDAKDPWDFDKSDFQLFIAADRTEADGPARSRSRSVLSSTRIGAGALPTSFAAISPNIGQPPFLLQAGQAALIRFEAAVKPELAKFLASHPDAQRCTLSYNQDYPIGAIGSLSARN
jgi:hypothetical protein